MSEEEEVTEKKKLFSFLSRDRKVLEIGEVSQLPCFIFHFFSAAVVVHKSTSEALVQTKGSWKKKRRQGERKVRGGGGRRRQLAAAAAADRTGPLRPKVRRRAPPLAPFRRLSATPPAPQEVAREAPAGLAKDSP